MSIYLSILAITSCKRDFPVSGTVSGDDVFPTKKLENPYSVFNMKRAFHRLMSEGAVSLRQNPVHTTHYYVRFEPSDWAEYEALKSVKGLELFDYPLDYENYEYEGSFHDPGLPADKPTYQYAAVPVDFQFPNVPYTLLEELYLPEEDEALSRDTTLLYQLEYKALEITGNWEEPVNGGNDSERYGRWRPSGRILVHDDVGAYGNMISYLNLWDRHKIPVENARVRIRRWFTTVRAVTDEKGYFTSPRRFRRPVNYSIIWETPEFDIRDGTFGQAYYNGPKMRANWYLTITGGKSLRYATIHRAACRYQYYNIGGLKRPNVWSKLKYCYYYRAQRNDAEGDNWGNWDFTGAFPDIRIFGKSYGEWIPTNQLYSTTIHETAHASHIELMNGGEIQYAQVSKRIYESWADAVEWYITRIEYRWLGNYFFDAPGIKFVNGRENPFQYVNNKQNTIWDIYNISHSNYYGEYTPMFIDLVDDFNQRNFHHRNDLPCDEINQNQYTMGYLEPIVYLSDQMHVLYQNLMRHRPPEVTAAMLHNQLQLYLSY